MAEFIRAKCDDISTRRNDRQAFFSAIEVVDTTTILFIVEWLHDTWSVIRNDAVNALKGSLENLDIDVVDILIEKLIIHDDSSPWQLLHGSLLGLIVLVSVTRNEKTIDAIKAFCFKVLADKSPVTREAASNCLLEMVRIGKLPISALTIKVLVGINGLSIDDVDALDGVLGCLEGCINEVTTFLCEDVNKRQSIVGEFDYNVILMTLDNVMGHPSSSVARQRSGRILSLFYSKLVSMENDYQNDVILKLNSVLRIENMETIDSTSFLAWQKRETCFMAAADIVRSVLHRQLTLMSTDANWTGNTAGASFLLWLSTLRGHLIDMTNERFEIRRAAGQILHSVARATVILQPSALSDLLNLVVVVNSENSFVDEITLQSLVYCAWVSAVGNAAQHIIEVCDSARLRIINPSDESMASRQDVIDISDVESVSSTDNFGYLEKCSVGFWVLETAGRLGEEDDNQQYSVHLKDVCIRGNKRVMECLIDSLSKVKEFLLLSSDTFLRPTASLRDDQLIELPELECDSLSEINQMLWLTQQRFVACDYIEAAAITSVFLFRWRTVRVGVPATPVMVDHSNQSTEVLITNQIPLFVMLLGKLCNLLPDDQTTCMSGLPTITKGDGRTLGLLLPSVTDPMYNLTDPHGVQLSLKGFHSWLCESLAALIPTLAVSESPPAAGLLSVVVSSWVVEMARNSLLLDSRGNAKKLMFLGLRMMVSRVIDYYSESVRITIFEVAKLDSIVTSQYSSFSIRKVVARIASNVLQALSESCPGLDAFSATCVMNSFWKCLIQPPTIPTTTLLSENTLPNYIGGGTNCCTEQTVFDNNQQFSNHGILDRLENALDFYLIKFPLCSVEEDRKVNNACDTIVESEEDDFSDWDEEEDEVFDDNKLPSSHTITDDVTNMHKEIKLIQTYCKLIKHSES